MFPVLVWAGFKPAWNQRSRSGIPVVRRSRGGFQTRPYDPLGEAIQILRGELSDGDLKFFHTHEKPLHLFD